MIGSSPVIRAPFECTSCRAAAVLTPFPLFLDDERQATVWIVTLSLTVLTGAALIAS